MAEDPFGFCGSVLSEKYRIDELIGEGGFALVYRGVHLQLETPVAVKCLKVPTHFTGPARQLFFDKFREEGKHLAKLSGHPSILRVFDFGVASSAAGPAAYLVLEWLSGKNMEDLLAERIARKDPPLTALQALAVVRPAVDAIAYAHGLGIAHRDLKPANLYWVTTPRGKLLKVLDFGIAKVMQEGDAASQIGEKTSSGFNAFSPRYGAPEQFHSSRFGQTGPWTDVHALGLVLVEMMVGRAAWAGEEMADFLLVATQAERPTPRTLGLTVSDEIEELCKKALALDPRDRFATAKDMLVAIDAVLGPTEAALPLDFSGEPSQAAKDPTPPTPPAADSMPTGEYEELRKRQSATPSKAATPSRATLEAVLPVATEAAAPIPLHAASPTPNRNSAGRYVVLGVAAAGIVVAGGYLTLGRAGPAPPPVSNRAVASVAVVPIPSASAVIESVPSVVEIALGGAQGCARRNNGEISCWGERGGTVLKSPALLANLGAVSQIALGAGHGCARRETGSVVCWGDNASGAVGDGTTTSRAAPVPVVGLAGASQIATGTKHSCALGSDGSVLCWGDNSHGQLGDGSLVDRPSPTTVGGLAPIQQISLGGSHTCALGKDGSVFCWGENDHGQLGDGTTKVHNTPVQVQQLSDVVSIASGGWHNCARKKDGAVLCWGGNYYGQLGDGATTNRSVPVPIPGLQAEQLALGAFHTCSRSADGRVSCWGENAAGQLGNGTTTRSLTPVAVTDLTKVAYVAVAVEHTCVLDLEGRVLCWGANDRGQLGDGTTAHHPSPVVAFQ